MSSRTIFIASRGSALALAQSNMMLAQLRKAFPARPFELKIIKTTGDRMQTMNLANPNQEVTKGLFTKELEVALLNSEADLAVHSLKDLPTELPAGLQLTAVTQREDVRDAFIYPAEGASKFKKGLPRKSGIKDLAEHATVATSSTRRVAQLLAIRPELKTVPIRGNVGTRLQKLIERDELHAIILAMAGLKRLGFSISENGDLKGEGIPSGLIVTPLPTEQMLPCVGQAALGIESRSNDPEIDEICAALNHPATHACVLAERAFLQGMGGGCLSPVAALGEISGDTLRIRAVSFRNEKVRRGEDSGPIAKAAELGLKMAERLSN